MVSSSLYSIISPSFTRNLVTPGLEIGYEDSGSGGVWEFLVSSIQDRLPLRFIEWKNRVGVTKTIDQLNLHFVSSQQVIDQKNVDSSVNLPLVWLYIVKCEEMERYKSHVRHEIAKWVEKMNALKVEWMIVYVPLGTRTSKKQTTTSKAWSVMTASMTSAVIGSSSTSHTSGSSGSNSTSTTTSTHTPTGSSVYKKIYDKIKADFGQTQQQLQGTSSHKRTSTNTTSTSTTNMTSTTMSDATTTTSTSSTSTILVGHERTCKLDALEGGSVVMGTTVGAGGHHESQWSELMSKIRHCIMDALETKCFQYEEELRALDAKRGMNGWDFGTFFVVKENLALMYQQAYLLDDAIRHMDELEAVYTSSKTEQERQVNVIVQLTNQHCIFTNAPLALNLDETQTQIATNVSTDLSTRLYLFIRQIRILYLMGDFPQLIDRAINFIGNFFLLLLKEQQSNNGGLQWFHPYQWAVGVCFEIAYACEMSWNGHDYEVSSASVPENVTQALTPEIMSKQLGEILYLARRILKNIQTNNKKTIPNHSSTIDIVNTEKQIWYLSIQRMFVEENTNDDNHSSLDQCFYEVSHLASLHFSRAGRHRFAVYLGFECAKYHFMRNEWESALRLLRSHARQCQEDKWWTLLKICEQKICISELQLNRIQQAIHSSGTILQLIAKEDKANEAASKDFFQLFVSTFMTKSIGNHWTFSQLFPITIEIQSDVEESVQLDLSIQNRYPIDVHVDNMTFYFHQKKKSKQKTQEDNGTLVIPQVMEQLIDQVDTCFIIEEKNIVLTKSRTTNLVCVYKNKHPFSNGKYECTKMECILSGQTITLTTTQKLYVDIFSSLSSTSSSGTQTKQPQPSSRNVQLNMDTFPQTPIIPSNTNDIQIVQLKLNAMSLENVQVDICINFSDNDQNTPMLNRIESIDNVPFEFTENKPYKISIKIPHCSIQEMTWNVYVDTKDPGDFYINSVLKAQEEDDENVEIEVDKRLTVVDLLTPKIVLQQMDDKIFMSLCLIKTYQGKGIVLKKYDWLSSQDNQLIVEQDPNDHLMDTILQQSNQKVYLAFVLARQQKEYKQLKQHVLHVYYEIDELSRVQYCLPVKIPFNKLNQPFFHLDMSAVTEPTNLKWTIGELIQFEIKIKCSALIEKEKDTLIEVSFVDTSTMDWIIVGQKTECLRVKNDGLVVFYKTIVPCRMGLLFYPIVSLTFSGQLMQIQNVHQAQRGRQLQIHAASVI